MGRFAGSRRRAKQASSCGSSPATELAAPITAVESRVAKGLERAGVVPVAEVE